MTDEQSQIPDEQYNKTDGKNPDQAPAPDEKTNPSNIHELAPGEPIDIPMEAINEMTNHALKLFEGNTLTAVIAMITSGGMMAGYYQTHNTPAGVRQAKVMFKTMLEQAFDNGKIQRLQEGQASNQVAQANKEKIDRSMGSVPRRPVRPSPQKPDSGKVSEGGIHLP